MAEPKPFTTPIQPGTGFQRLVAGVPETHGMKSGRVSMDPGDQCGWHSTKGMEETLVVLQGRGRARIKGPQAREFDFEAPCVVYVPPRTEHNMTCLGPDPLCYVYIVAPVQGCRDT